MPLASFRLGGFLICLSAMHLGKRNGNEGRPPRIGSEKGKDEPENEKERQTRPYQEEDGYGYILSALSLPTAYR